MKKFIVTAVVFIITAVLVCFSACNKTDVSSNSAENKTDSAEISNKNNGEIMLYLCYQNNDKVIKTFEVSEGSEFSIEFIHSVNKSPLKDVFIIRDGKIFADRTIYSAFGAGVQTEVEEGQTLSYDENMNMVVSGFNTEFPRVKCVVGTISDHILEIGGETISLTELCGKNALVYFELR